MKDVLLCAAFVGLLWLPLGSLVLRLCGRGKIPHSASLALALGMGTWGLAVLVLGAASALYRPVVIASAAAALLARRYSRLRAGPPGAEFSYRPCGVPGEKLLIAALLGVSAAYCTIVLASALAPEAAFDALNVYLPYARSAATAHRLGFAPNNWNSSMPVLPLASYATAFLFSGENLAKLFNACCYLGCGALIYGFSNRRFTSLHAASAAALFWSSPLALYEATTALIDLPLALFSALALRALAEWTGGGERPWLWLSAAGLGMALGSKYHAAFLIPPVFLILAWDALKVRRNTPREALGTLAAYGAIAAALAAPWLLRAWWYTGNPIFPLANSYFRSPYFTPAMETAARAAYRLEGIGEGWRGLVSLPWLVTFHPGPFRGTLGVLLLPALALALVAWPRLRDVRYAALVVGIFFCEWALTAQEIRYLIPLLPLLAWIAPVAVLGGDATGARRFGMRGALSCAGIAVVLAGAVSSWPSLYPRWTREWTYWHAYQSPFPYLLGQQSAQEFLRRDVPSIWVYDYINRNLSDRNRVLLLNDASQFYARRVPTLYSYTVEGDALLLEESVDGLLRRLEQSRIDFVLLNYNEIAPLTGVARRPGVDRFLDPGFRARYLEEVYARNDVVLYRVRR